MVLAMVQAFLAGAEDSRVHGDGPARARGPTESAQPADLALRASALGTARPRVPWTGSRFAGTPDPPPPYAVEPAFPQLKLEFPVVLVPAQGTGRLFVGELKGRIYSFPNDPDCRQGRPGARSRQAASRPVGTLRARLSSDNSTRTRYVYVCYVLKNDVPDGSVVSRFTVSRTDPPVIDPKSEQVILNFWSGGHNGGCLDFGKDGYLYISTGDGAAPSPPDTKMTGQDCSDLLSSILRIDVDHRRARQAVSRFRPTIRS